MANDGKTMSDLFMSLMQGLDDEDEKKKRGFIPGTSIPMPDPNSLIPPVLDQFQTPPVNVKGSNLEPSSEVYKKRLEPKQDVPPVQNVPQPTSAYDPVANRERYEALVAQNTANRKLQQAAYDANKQQTIEDADLSGFIPSIPSAQRMGKELSLQLGVPAKIIEEAGKGVGNLALKGVETMGDPVVRFGQGFIGSEPTGIESGSLGRYYINDPYRPFSDSPSDVPPESDIPVPKDAKGTPVITAADQAKEKGLDDIVQGMQAEQDKEKGLDDIVQGMQAEQDKEKGLDDLIRRFEEDSTNLTKEDVNNAGSKLDPKVKEQVDNSISQADFPRGMMGDDGEIFDNANPDDIPKKSEGVFKSLWNGIKDIAKEGFEDPALRRALFAYTASKVLGYDGVTLATGVLENEWQKQSAQLKAERESAIEEAKYKRERNDALFDNNVKFQQDVILKQIDNNAELTKEEKKNQVDFNTYDLISPKTFYNTGNRTNHVGAVNKPGTHVKFNEDVLVSQLDDNGDAVQVRIPMGAPVPIASLTNYGVTVGRGITGSEITDTYSKKFNDRMTKYKSDVFNMKSFTELPEAKQEDIKAQLSVIGGNVYELVETVLSTMPKGTVDTNEKGFTSAIERAAQVVVDDVVSGRSKNNAEIVSSIISERLTFDFRAMRLMGSDFKITNKDHKDKKIGLNSLTGILDKTSKAAQDLPNYRDKYDVLSELSAVYGSLDSKAKEKYEANSLNSLDDEEFPERYKTPFMSYVELKFDDNPQETMTILRNRRSK